MILLIIAGATAAYYFLSNPLPSGGITVYGSIDANDMQPLLNAFESRYPSIAVTYTEMTPPTAFTRITSEVNANQSSADAVVLSNPILKNLAKGGYVLSYNSSERSAYREGYKDSKGYWTAAFQLPTAFAYNTQLVDKNSMPQTFEDLTNPKWRGKVIMHDITIGSVGTQMILSLEPVLGNESWTGFVQQLEANVHPTLTPDLGAISSEVARGEYSIGIIAFVHDVIELKEQGAPIDWFLPSGIPLPATLSSVSIVRTTTNLPAAQVFLDFVLSVEGQQTIGNTPVRIPARPSVTAKYTIESIAPNMEILLYPSDEVATQARSWGNKFKQMGYK